MGEVALVVSSSGARSRRIGVVLSYAYTLAQICVNLLYVPILLSRIGVSEFGLYQLVGSLMGYMAILNAMFSSGTTRFYCKFLAVGDVVGMENSLATCRWIYRIGSVVSIALGAIAILVVRSVYSGVLTPFQLTESSVMLGVMVINLIVTMSNAVHVAIINGHERFGFLKATQLATVVLQPIAVILLLGRFPYAVTVTLVQLGMNIVCSLSQFLFARNVLSGKVIFHGVDRRLIREILRYSFGILSVLVADQLFWSSNQLILGFHFGTATVAVYGIAFQIVMAYVPLGTAVSSVFMPRVSEIFHGERNMRALSDLWVRVGRLSAFVAFLVLGGFLVFGHDFIALWAGEGLSEAYWIALVIMVPFTIDLLQNLGLVILQVMDRYYFRGKVNLVIALISVALAAYVAPRFGAIGVAIVTGTALFFGNGVAMNVYYSRRVDLDVRAFWGGVSGIFVRTLPLVLLAYFLVSAVSVEPSWTVLVCGMAVFVVGYSLFAYFVCMNASERDLVDSTVRRIRL